MFGGTTEFPVVISGSRERIYEREFYKEQIFEILDMLLRTTKVSFIGHGDARGIDTVVSKWCEDRKVAHREFKADWKNQGKSAGPIRNALALKIVNPKVVLLFPGNTGTANMKLLAMRQNRHVVEVKLHDTPEAWAEVQEKRRILMSNILAQPDPETQ